MKKVGREGPRKKRKIWKEKKLVRLERERVEERGSKNKGGSVKLKEDGKERRRWAKTGRQ